MRRALHFLTDIRGATAIEYCFIAASIALVIFGAVGTVGTKIGRYFTQIAAVN